MSEIFTVTDGDDKFIHAYSDYIQALDHIIISSVLREGKVEINWPLTGDTVFKPVPSKIHKTVDGVSFEIEEELVREDILDRLKGVGIFRD